MASPASVRDATEGAAARPGSNKAASLQPEYSLSNGADRRHVTVLFADVAGFTTFAERLDPEDVRAFQSALFETLGEAVGRYDGYVEKFVGDAVMAVFGAPVAHGDDPARALNAALDMLEGSKRLSETWASRLGQAVKLHIGVHTGPVVAGNLGSTAGTAYAVTGDTVNTTARLLAAASGTILVSGATHALTQHRFVFDEARELSVRGKAQPVVVHRLVRALTEPQSTRDWPFVGRRAELRQFASVLRACSDDGVGQMVVLRGEAGIGKTRLSEEFERMAGEAGFATHRGLVLDFGAETGRDAIRSIFRDLLGIGPRPRADELQRASQQAVANGIVGEELEVHLNDLLDAPQPDKLRAFYDAMDVERRLQGRAAAMGEILASAVRQQPRLLIVEDVHWARPPLLRALAQVAHAISERSAIIVITSRIEGDPLDRFWRASVAGIPLTTVDLSPLRAEDARTICAAIVDDPEAVSGLVSRAGGNPLFLEQLLRHANDAEGESVPGTIQSLVQSAIDQLSVEDRRTVQAASVIGQRVDPALLRFLTEGGGENLRHLTERHILRPQGQDYLFVHALIRDAVYASLLTPARKTLHLRAAKWFEKRDLRLNAEHLAVAGAPEAPAAFLAAAREEAAKYHYENALTLVERGLSVAAAATDIIALRLFAGETWHAFGRMAEARQAFSLAADEAISGADLARALIGLAEVKRVVDDLDGAFHDLQQAEQTAVEHGLIAERARVHFLRGNLYFPKGELARCHREHEQGLRFAREAGRSDLEAASLGGLGDAEYVRGRMASARRRLEECVELAARQGLGRIEVANKAQVVHAMLYDGSQEEAYEAARTAVRAAEQVGHSRAAINARASVIMALFALGRYEECLEEIAAYEACIGKLGAIRFRQGAYMHRGPSLHALSRTGEAIADLEEGIEFARSTGYAFHGPSTVSALAVIIDDGVRRRALIDEALNACLTGCVGHNQFRVYADGIDVAYELGDAELLQRITALAADYPEGERLAWSDFQAMRGRALLGRLRRGETPEVRAAEDAVLQRGRELGMRHWLPR
jgi:class 3 adenylate cyclase/tetratricopeptide (TPR) repeat protein